MALDAGDRIPGGRRDRVPGEHGSADGDGPGRPRSDAAIGARDQLHDSGDDDFAGGGVHSAGVHERAGRAHLPRIFDHHHRFDLRQRHRVADADAADVLAAAGQRGAGAKKTWMERVIGGVEHRVLDLYGRSLWFFLRQRWISALIWVDLPGGHGVSVLRRPQGVSAGRRQLVHSRRFRGAGRLVAGPDARLSGESRRGACRPIRPWT